MLSGESGLKRKPDSDRRTFTAKRAARDAVADCVELLVATLEERHRKLVDKHRKLRDSARRVLLRFPQPGDGNSTTATPERHANERAAMLAQK